MKAPKLDPGKLEGSKIAARRSRHSVTFVAQREDERDTEVVILASDKEQMRLHPLVPTTMSTATCDAYVLRIVRPALCVNETWGRKTTLKSGCTSALSSKVVEFCNDKEVQSRHRICIGLRCARSPDFRCFERFADAHRLDLALAFEPGLKHHDAPQPGRPVTLLGNMFPPESSHGGVVQIAFVREAPLIDKRFGPIPQRAAKPLPYRDGKTGLRTFENICRKIAIEDLPQCPFAAPVPDLHGERQTPRDFGDAMVEHGDARFQTDRHSGAIDLRENVVGEIG